MLVKYIGNPSIGDRTEIITLANRDGRSGNLVLGGPAVDITDQEYYGILANGYQLERVEETDIPQGEVETADEVTDVEDQPSESEDQNLTSQSFGASSPMSPYGADHEGA